MQGIFITHIIKILVANGFFPLFLISVRMGAGRALIYYLDLGIASGQQKGSCEHCYGYVVNSCHDGLLELSACVAVSAYKTFILSGFVPDPAASAIYCNYT